MFDSDMEEIINYGLRVRFLKVYLKTQLCDNVHFRYMFACVFLFDVLKLIGNTHYIIDCVHIGRVGIGKQNRLLTSWEDGLQLI